MQSLKDIQKEKKPYQKPDLKAIALVAEEILATGCKTNSAPGIGVSPVTCILAPCSTPGS